MIILENVVNMTSIENAKWEIAALPIFCDPGRRKGLTQSREDAKAQGFSLII
jgi:hypothetical protein